jgi:hypothetical protein
MGTVSVATITKAPHTVNSIFGNAVNAVWIDEANSAYPRNDKLKFKGDPLALVLAYREKDMENWKITERLTSSSTWDLLATKEHVRQANDIKKYYRNKFILNALKHSDHGMSKFRRDLREYVESDDPYTVYKNDIPMIVKLPDFYEEDKMMDEFQKEYHMTSEFYTMYNGITTLKPLRKHQRKTKNHNAINYWFTDHSNRIYRISIKPDNELIHLFEREFDKDLVTMDATFYPTKMRGQDYVFFNVNKWTIR